MPWTAITRTEHGRKFTRYPSDLTDAEWRVMSPLVPAARRGGRRRTTNMREVLIPTFSEADSYLGFPKRSISESMSRTAWRLVWEQRFRFGRTTVRMT